MSGITEQPDKMGKAFSRYFLLPLLCIGYCSAITNLNQWSNNYFYALALLIDYPRFRFCSAF